MPGLGSCSPSFDNLVSSGDEHRPVEPAPRLSYTTARPHNSADVCFRLIMVSGWSRYEERLRPADLIASILPFVYQSLGRSVVCVFHRRSAVCCLSQSLQKFFDLFLVAMFSHVTLLSLAVFATVASAQTCYGLDGTQLDNTFAPCKSNTNHSACCATKRSSNPDICLDSGLCMSTEPQFMGMTWQNGCTDITGKDVACPKICPDGTSPTSIVHGM